MGIFEYEQIRSLNEKEFGVYNYIFTHQQEAVRMNIRELAEKTGVSTTTVLRTCKKIGCEGYTELKYQIRKQLKPERKDEQDNRLLRVMPAVQYLQHSMEDTDLEKKMEELANVCMQSHTVLFLGTGAEAGLARYGAYLLAETGIAAYAVDDPCYPVLSGGPSGKVTLLVFAVSGENDRLIACMDNVKKKRGYMASITNTDQCVTAKLSDVNFPCFMPVSHITLDQGETRFSSQIPVICLLERLADCVYGLLRKQR